MANLPDLQTTLISTLCYFDAGVTIKKSDVLPILESFTEYDNGVDGVMAFTFDGTRTTAGNRVRIQVRIRTDGMCYAWGLRADEDTTGTQKESNAIHPWQRALLPVSGYGAAPATQDTLLFRAVQALVAAVTTAGKTTPLVGTVSYYDFQYTSTGNIYVFGAAAGNNQTSNFQFTQPPGVSIFVLACRVSIAMTSGSGQCTMTMGVNSTTLVSRANMPATSFVQVWMTRQGANVTSILQPTGTQNNAFTQNIVQFSTAGQSTTGVLVIYASS